MDKLILYAAINHYGKPAQTLQFFEEVAEFEKEICKNNRGFDNKDELAEEFADLQIMLDQIKIMYDIKDSQIEMIMQEKLERLKKRIGYCLQK